MRFSSLVGFTHLFRMPMKTHSVSTQTLCACDVSYCIGCAKFTNDHSHLILMDPCNVDYSVEIPTRFSFIIEFIIPIILLSCILLVFLLSDHSNVPSHYRNIYVVKPTRCTSFSNLFYFIVALYMFQTVFPSIIRSLRVYTQHQVYVKQILLTAC